MSSRPLDAVVLPQSLDTQSGHRPGRRRGHGATWRGRDPMEETESACPGRASARLGFAEALYFEVGLAPAARDSIAAPRWLVAQVKATS